MTMLLLAALLPPVFLIRSIYRLDAVEKESPSLLWRLFFAGVLAIIPAMILELLLERVLLAAGFQGMLYHVLENFIGIALVEEGCKYLFLRRKTWNHPEFNYRFDAIVYSVVVSMGFAALENVMYVFESGLSVALLRAVTSIPGHAIFAVYMGYYYGQAKYLDRQGDTEGRRRYGLLCLLVPVLLHGFYDFTLSVEIDWMPLVFIVYTIILDVLALRTVKRNAREDHML